MDVKEASATMYGENLYNDTTWKRQQERLIRELDLIEERRREYERQGKRERAIDTRSAPNSNV